MNPPRSFVEEAAVQTASPRRQLLVHPTVLDWIHASDTPPQLARRARLVLWQMLTQGGPTQVKSVRGAGRGWLRADLGGNNGHQYYLWWARPGSVPVKALGLRPHELLVRAVRHHDDTHLALEPGERGDGLPLEASELDGYALSPTMQPEQLAALGAQGRVRLIRGQPGTGKTTVLALAAAKHQRRVLYLTYSDRLAAQARAYFREFLAEGVRVETFTDALRLIAPGDRSNVEELPDPVKALEEALERFKGKVTPWEGRLDALYAELHASFVGAALPWAFRSASACNGVTFEPSDYVALRREAIGQKAAESAAMIGRFLLEEGVLPRIAPCPVRARALLDAVVLGELNLSALHDVEAVYVDEVQDLTRVEAALLAELVARISTETGRAIELVAAGDEGQTVRPTEFDWGVLSDLLDARLVRPSRIDLVGNVRSPRTLAAVVQRAGRLYRGVPKEERPRGQGEADIDDAVEGRVIRCRVKDDDELARVMELLREVPSTAVVCPGWRAPADVVDARGEIFTSERAKGLEFRIVAVLGAGPHLAALTECTTKGAVSALEATLARTMIDQLRVSLSRPTDTLILLDRAGDPGDALVEQLCQDANAQPLEGSLGEVCVDDLAGLLSRDDATAEEQVHEIVRDVRASMARAPLRALDQMRHARGLLGRADSRVGVTDPSLRREVHRGLGVAALRVALAADAEEKTSRALCHEANRTLHTAGDTDAGNAARCLRELRWAPSQSAARATELTGVLAGVERAVPELAPTLRAALVGWCEVATTMPLPDGAAGLRTLVEAVEASAAALDGRVSEKTVDAVRLRVARGLRGMKKPAEALAVLARCGARSLADEAGCLEDAERFAEAAGLYESLGEGGAALRCVRQSGDLERALRLARVLDAPEADALARAVACVEALRALGSAVTTLHGVELRGIAAAADAVLPGRSRARKG